MGPSVGIIGVPSDSAGIRGGVALAPSALRAAGLVTALDAIADVEDLGDLPLPTPIPGRDPATSLIDPAMFAAVVEGVAGGVASTLGRGRFPIVLGGDCSLLLGCIAGSGARGLLFVDGHEDAYPPAASPTGEVADMELGFLIGLHPVPAGVGLHPGQPEPLDPAAVVVMGARDGPLLRQQSVASLRGTVPFVDDAELATDPETMTRRALATIARPWWLHIDLDVLSTEAFGAVDYPQDGGIGWTDLAGVVREAFTEPPLGIDVTIYNPELDPDGSDARRIVSFLAGAIRALPA